MSQPRFEDAEQAWIDHLNPRLDVPVSGERVGDTCVKVHRAGGVRQNRIIDNPMMIFECYAPDADHASKLARDTQAHVFGAAGTTLEGGQSCKAIRDVSGPAKLPDPEAPTLSRYTFTVMTALKATVVADEQLRGTPA